MTRGIELSAWVWLALAGAGVIISLVRVVRRRGPFCPGPRARFAALKPWRWFFVGDCGYDLSMVPAQPDGTVRCPECGGVHTRIPKRRAGSWRAVPWAAVFVLVGLVCRDVRAIRRGGWAKPLPTTVLLVIEDTIRGEWSRPVRRALEDRHGRGALWGWQERTLARIAVDELGDDRIDKNADWGLDVLRDVSDGAVPIIEAGLDSDDYQRRQCCAHVLRQRTKWYLAKYEETSPIRRTRYLPPHRLFEVTVEGLAADELRTQIRRGQSVWISNANEGLRFLLAHPEQATLYLIPAIRGDDLQQRVLASVVLAAIGNTEYADEYVPVLIEQLADNSVWNDATVCVSALRHTGMRAQRYLELASHSADPQQRLLSRLLLAELERGVPRTNDPPCDIAAWFPPHALDPEDSAYFLWSRLSHADLADR